MREYDIHPEDFGLAMQSNRSLRVAGAAESKDVVLAALGDAPLSVPSAVEHTAREIVLLNAGTALYAANTVDSIGAGIAAAREAVASGAARAKLEQFVAVTRRLAS